MQIRDNHSLEIPKAFFASARSVVNGGSLTIIASAIVDTGSRIDDVIYEEFKGTSNMEIHLDRELADMRVFPAINCHKSGTLKEEKLYTPKELQCMTMLRRSLATIDKKDATLQLLDVLSTTKNTEEFLDDLQSKKRSFAQLKKH